MHLLASVLVVVLGGVVGLDRWSWVAVVLAMGLVWMAEALNTAVEVLADVVTLEEHPGIRRAKDLAAGGVLLASVAAGVVGVVVFGGVLLF